MSWRGPIDACRAGAVQALRALDRAIMPERCVFCGTESGPAETVCCAGCAADLPWNASQCSRCAEPLVTAESSGVDCALCQQRPPPLTAVVAPLKYAFPVDAAIKALKFHRRLEYVAAFGSLLAAMLPRLPDDIDALLPVPLHWRRHALRGFNQAAELCKPLARWADLPLLTAVERVRDTAYQSGLDAADRRRNLRDAFVTRRLIAARHVLIVDDVITTGATSRQLARVALEAGADRVSALAVAKAAQLTAG